MERSLGFKMVQAQIGYDFKNIDLLNQAFIRRSYSEEHGGENNEVLEFIGDKSLDLAVIKILTSRFGNMDTSPNTKLSKSDFVRELCATPLQQNDSPNEFSCERTENELTKLKSYMVEKKTLAKRMDELGFAELLLMGNSDIKNNVADEMSVKEDLFEAILGAVTIDCGWDLSVIESVVDAMLVPDNFIENYVDNNYVQMIYDWESEVNHTIPLFWFDKWGHTGPLYEREPNIIYNYPTMVVGRNNSHKFNYSCKLKLLDDLPVFCGFGESKSEARMNVCQSAYEYLGKNGYIQYKTMRDEIGEPDKDSAINQLEILARRKYFSIPTYKFEESHDKDGNPIWTSRCRITEYNKSFFSKSSLKKEAKKLSAMKMLEYVLAHDDEKNRNR